MPLVIIQSFHVSVCARQNTVYAKSEMVSYFSEETFLSLHFISLMKLRNLKDSHHNSIFDLMTAVITNMMKLTSQYAFERRILLRRISLRTVTNSLLQLTQEGELDASNLTGCTESGELCPRFRKANLFYISIGHCRQT